MLTDHADVARRAFASITLPDTPRPVASALPYIVRLLEWLPPGEEYGYVKGPRGGENVTPLPDGTLVRISRVMSPDGQIYKVLSDAPNGKPQWVAEDIRPELYVPFWRSGSAPPDGGEPAIVPTVVSFDAVHARLDGVEQSARDFKTLHGEVAHQIGLLNNQLANMDTTIHTLRQDMNVLTAQVQALPTTAAPSRPPWWPFR